MYYDIEDEFLSILFDIYLESIEFLFLLYIIVLLYSYYIVSRYIVYIYSSRFEIYDPLLQGFCNRMRNKNKILQMNFE